RLRRDPARPRRPCLRLRPLRGALRDRGRGRPAAARGRGDAMIRVAVVGAGAWGINHVRAFARTKGAELVLVCDPSEASRERARGLAPRARTAPSLEDALSAPDVDAVVLATPAVQHASHAQLALAAGKHVMVEKPLALNGAEAER